MAQRSISAWALRLSLVAACATPSAWALLSQADPLPRPVRGVPLAGQTELQLVVAAVPPFLLDVDTGRTAPIDGLPGAEGVQVLWVQSIGPEAAIVAVENGPTTFYVVRRTGQAVRLGTGASVWPAADDSVWIVSRDATGCNARRLGLDGRARARSRRITCVPAFGPATAVPGEIVGRNRIIDPVSARVVARTRLGIIAAASRHLVLDAGASLVVLDRDTGERRQLPVPSTLARGGAWIDAHGRYVALEFGDPAWRGGGDQVMDLWVLDLATGALTQVPGMPAFVGLKGTSMGWSDDGRLVILGVRPNDREFVAIWRPGTSTLQVKQVGLPDRSESGSDSFAVIR